MTALINIESMCKRVSMLHLTAQQQNILKLVDANQTTIINSSAGSGKSTLLYSVGLQYPDEKCLLLTFSSKLKVESRIKMNEMNIENICVDSFHSACCRFYSTKQYDDRAIIDVCKNDIQPTKNMDFGIVCLDEIQDIKDDIYVFIRKILNDIDKCRSDVSKPLKIIVCGDVLQSIYTFLGGSSKFLSTPQYWDLSGNLSKSLCVVEMQQSHRVPQIVVDFMKHVCGLKTNMTGHSRPGASIEYRVCNLYQGFDTLCVVEEALKTYEAHAIFILSHSLKSKKIKHLESLLGRTKVPLFMSESGDIPVTEKVLESKLCFGTIHSSKGSQRKCTILIGFSPRPDEDFQEISNEVYVALTRTQERLIIVQHCGTEAYGFVNQDLLKSGRYNSYTEITPLKLSMRPKKTRDVSKGVVEIVRNLSATQLDTFLKSCTITRVREPDSESIEIEKYVPNVFGGYEQVACYTGLAIPAYWEYHRTNDCHLFEGETLENPSVKHFLRAAVVYKSNRDFCYPMFQINKYKWMSKEQMDMCARRFDSVVGQGNIQFEKSIKLRVGDRTVITGSIDAVNLSTDELFEFKTTSGPLSDQMIIQCLFYLWILSDKHAGVTRHMTLFNVLSNECLRISCNDSFKSLSQMDWTRQ